MSNELKEKLQILPDLPGVYLMKNEGGRLYMLGRPVLLEIGYAHISIKRLIKSANRGDGTTYYR